MKRMTTGTSWFPTMADAVAYYQDYGERESDVLRKIEEGEINIGEPATWPNEVDRFVKDRRWHIVTV